MRRTITQSELRDEGAAIMRRVAAGERFTVTVDEVPVADLVPHRRETRRERIPAIEIDAVLPTLPPIDVEARHGDRAEIDGLLADCGSGSAQDDLSRDADIADDVDALHTDVYEDHDRPR